MGYDASVYVIYGTQLNDVDAFIKLFIENHPDIKKKGEDDGYEMTNREVALEYIENYCVEDIDGNQMMCTDIKTYICSYYHKQSVTRSRDQDKKLILPELKEMSKFDDWCSMYNLTKPCLMTVVRESY